MPKVTGPLMSVDARGTLGDVLTYQKGMKGSRVGRVPLHRDMRSALQRERRNSFKDATYVWRCRTPAEKAEYDARAIPWRMTGYNLFLKEYSPLIWGLGLPPLRAISKHVTRASDESSVTFSDILSKVPAGSRHLALVVSAASDQGANSRAMRLRFNGDAGNNYGKQNLKGNGAGVNSNEAWGTDNVGFGAIPGQSYPDAFAAGVAIFPHAFGTTNYKAEIVISGCAEEQVELHIGTWSDTSAITSVTIFPASGNFAVGSVFILAVVDERYCLAEVLLEGDGLVSFEEIPQVEGDLAVVAYNRTDRSGEADFMWQEINGDAANAHYARQRVHGYQGDNQAAPRANDREIGATVGDTATSGAFGALVVSLSQFVEANQPHYTSLGGAEEAVSMKMVYAYSGRRKVVEPITKLEYKPKFGTKFKAGSLFSLYYVPTRIIKRVELAEDTPSVTFDGIPTAFEALLLNVYARSGEASDEDEVQLECNGDTTLTNYDMQELTGADDVVAAARSDASRQLLYIPGNNQGSNEFGGGQVLIPCYTRAGGHKAVVALHGSDENKVAISSHRWESTAPVTQLVLTTVSGSDFKAGSIFELGAILPVLR